MNYQIIPAIGKEVPILISIPHCGTDFPDELKNQYHPKLIETLDDTDWFVHQLYNFAPSIGITIIHAKYSRWVIDLNRYPQSSPMYSDGRIITTVCPTTTFLGEALYRDNRKEVEPAEVDRRLQKYFYPYHQKIEEHLSELKNKFNHVLLWDCHSIRQVVPTIQREKFPDLILGDADETSAAHDLINTTLDILTQRSYSVSHNHPFKGGYITRHFGSPQKNIHALQLEMTKVNYMDDSETKYEKSRADNMRELLKTVFSKLIERL